MKVNQHIIINRKTQTTNNKQQTVNHSFTTSILCSGLCSGHSTNLVKTWGKLGVRWANEVADRNKMGDNVAKKIVKKFKKKVDWLI